MLKRRYGNKQEELSIRGFGGILVKDTEPAAAERAAAATAASAPSGEVKTSASADGN